MKIKKKGVDRLHYKNGSKRYKAFIVVEGLLFNKKMYIPKNGVYWAFFTKDKDWAKSYSTEEAISALNEAIEKALYYSKENDAWTLIKTETTYIDG